MEYIILLDDTDEVECIDSIALSNNLSTEQYLTNICRGWIQSQLRGKYINAAKVAELSELKSALTTTVEKIAAAEALKAKGV